MMISAKKTWKITIIFWCLKIHISSKSVRGATMARKAIISFSDIN